MQKQSQIELSQTSLAQIHNKNESVEPTGIDFEVIIDQLPNVSQQLCRQSDDGTNQLCQYLLSVSKGKIQLDLHEIGDPILYPSSTNTLKVSVTYLDRIYGTLSASFEACQTSIDNIMPVRAIHRLAEKCGWALYTCEVTALIQSQYRHLNPNPQGNLTRQEKNVLFHLCCRKTKEEIARVLSITSRTVEKHKQHIYDKLDVHNEFEVVFVAYECGLFSPFDKRCK